MLRWIARCLLLHGVAPCELMGDTERSLHISLLFDLPWQADLAALATPTSPAVLSGGTSLGKWNFSFCLGGGQTRLFAPPWYVIFPRRLTPIVYDIVFFP
jgi:hypothetical protein